MYLSECCRACLSRGVRHTSAVLCIHARVWCARAQAAGDPGGDVRTCEQKQELQVADEETSHQGRSRPTEGQNNLPQCHARRLHPVRWATSDLFISSFVNTR